MTNEPSSVRTDGGTDDASASDGPDRGIRSRISGVFRLLVPGFIRRSYLVKFGLALVIIVLLIGTVGANAYFQTSETLDRQVETQVTTTAASQSETISDWQTQRGRWVRLLSEASAFQNDVLVPIKSYLQNEVKDIPDDVLRLHYINLESSEVLASSTSRFEGTVLSETNATWTQRDFSQIETSEAVESDVYAVNGEPVVAFISPIAQKSGFALVAVVDAQSVVTDFDQPINGSFTQVVSRDGTVMMDQRGTEEVLGPYIDAETGGDVTVLQEATANTSKFLTSSQKSETLSENYVVGYAPVQGTDWVVVTHAPESEAYLIRSNVTSQLMQILIVSLVGLALIGLTIGRGTVRSLERLSTRAKELEEGNLDVELFTTRDDEIGRLYESFASMRDSLRERITQAENALQDAEKARSDAEDARADAEAAREEAQQMNLHLEQKANEYREVMEACAAGDFTRRLEPESESEAMEEIAEAFNEMIDDIERIFATVGDFATDVSTASSEVSDSSNELEQTSNSVSTSIEQISQFADEQNDRMQTVSEEIQQMSATIEEIAATADNVADTSTRAAELADEGQEAAEDVVDEMENIEQQAETTLSEIRNLDDAIAEISEVADVITDIADQTNMLALNANIEAARAGQGGGGDGEGFAVVADEVKQLAEETKESAERIGELIENVQTQANKTVTEVEDMQTSVAEGAQTVESSVSAFQGISEQVAEADVGVQEINDATDGFAKSTQDLAAMTDEVANTSEETAEEANNVAAVTEEQTAAISQVSQNANNLYEQSKTLQELLDQFTTASEGVEDVHAFASDTPEIDASENAETTPANGGVELDEPSTATVEDVEADADGFDEIETEDATTVEYEDVDSAQETDDTETSDVEVAFEDNEDAAEEIEDEMDDAVEEVQGNSQEAEDEIADEEVAFENDGAGEEIEEDEQGKAGEQTEQSAEELDELEEGGFVFDDEDEKES